MKNIITIVLFSISSLLIKAQTFQDSPTGSQGDFPPKWNLIQGSAEIATLNGESIIYMANKGIISPKIGSANYLEDTFTLEFDAFYDEASRIPIHQYYEIRFWDGHSYMTLPNGQDFINPMLLYCHGAKIDGRINGTKVKYDGYLETMKDANNVWRHIAINYNNGALKVKIDDFQSINIPSLGFNPKMISIGAYSINLGTDFVRAIKNIHITGINPINNNDNNVAINTNNDDSTNNDSSSTGDSSTDTNTQTTEYTFPINDGDPNQILQTDGNGKVNWVDDTHPVVDTINTGEQAESYNYTLPTVDGTSNQILQTDGNGNVTWVDNNPVMDTNNQTQNDTISSGSGAQKINDLLDGKTTNDGESLFIGTGAGVAYSPTNGTNNDIKNLGIGRLTLANNTSGWVNVAIGYRSMYKNTSGQANTAIGYESLLYNLTGNFNTAIGGAALKHNYSSYNTAIGTASLTFNTTGKENTANGYRALYSNTTGINNTATGSKALYNNTTGINNTANGSQTLYSNTTGNYNIANGSHALQKNTTGGANTANGYQALYNNTTGYHNIANGYQALYSNTTGIFNTANGYSALYSNTTGNSNTAIGSSALISNTTGALNIAIGVKALNNNTTGRTNTAIGMSALYDNTTGRANTACGLNALENNTTGNYNTAIGISALSSNTTGDNNTAIGFTSQVPHSTWSNQVRIGNTDVTYAGVQVAWTVTSDKAWKEKIRSLPYGLEFVKQLKPVDYIRKKNENKTREMGFIAQDVEALLTKVGYKDQGVLTKDDKGLMSLRYNDFIALLTKAIQEQQAVIEDLQNKNNQYKASIDNQEQKYSKLTKRIEQLEIIMNQ